MDCKDIDNLLTAYLEGEVTPKEEEQVKKHLAECPHCRGELESLVGLRDKLRSGLKLKASLAEPPPGSWEKIVEETGIKKQEEKPNAKKSILNWLAAPVCISLLAILLVGFAGMFGGMAPPPPEPPILVGDGDGGAIVVWKDFPYYSSGGIYAQYVDAEGHLLWGENGIKVFDCEPGCETYLSEATSDGGGGVIVYWKYVIYRGDDVGYAQHISRDGEMLWGNDGIPSEDVPEEYALISPDSSSELGYDVVAVSISGTSVVIYEDPPFKTLGYSRVIDDSSGGVIVASRASEGGSYSQTYSVYA